MSDDLEPCDVHQEALRALMAGVRTAADRMKSRLPAHVDVNDVVSAGYLALTQALAYWQEGSGDPFEVHAMKRASAAMVAAARTSSSPSRADQRFVNEMGRVQQSLFDGFGPEAFGTGSTHDTELPEIDERTSPGTLDTIVSPPCNSEKPERASGVEHSKGEHDVAMEEIGVHVA